MTHRNFRMEGGVVWGYVAPAEFVGEDIFSSLPTEEDARELVRQSLPGARKLARRTLGPVELVEDDPAKEEMLKGQIERRLGHLDPADRLVVDSAMAGMTLQGKHDLVESFFVEES
jgi:hypothetical protein